MEYCRLQIGCLLIVVYIAFIYFRECRRYHKKLSGSVFDAVSEKRCYRDAMSLEQCFNIISEGRGRDFDPVIAEVFLDSKEKVEQIHNSIKAEVGRGL